MNNGKKTPGTTAGTMERRLQEHWKEDSRNNLMNNGTKGPGRMLHEIEVYFYGTKNPRGQEL